MACPNPSCNNKDVMTEVIWKTSELEELPGVFVMGLAILCPKCGWGFNCSGTFDKRQKKPTNNGSPIK